jgi:hypothetical protein
MKSNQIIFNGQNVTQSFHVLRPKKVNKANDFLLVLIQRIINIKNIFA